jgi:hypothetical protein
MNHWRQVLPVPLVHVSYERMVGDLEGESRRLVLGCRLAWEPACLQFHQTRRPVRTASVAQVRQPVYARSVGRWRNYAEALAPLFAALEGVCAGAWEDLRAMPTRLANSGLRPQPNGIARVARWLSKMLAKKTTFGSSSTVARWGGEAAVIPATPPKVGGPVLGRCLLKFLQICRIFWGPFSTLRQNAKSPSQAVTQPLADYQPASWTRLLLLGRRPPQSNCPLSTARFHGLGRPLWVASELACCRVRHNLDGSLERSHESTFG